MTNSTGDRARPGEFFPLALVWRILALNLFFLQIAGASGGFVKTSPMSSVRFGHSATLLADGRVLVAGGCNNQPNIWGDNKTVIASAEMFNSSNGTWSAASPMNSGRIFHTATLLTDGRVLVTGGCGVLTNDDAGLNVTFDSTELYDPSSGTWSKTGTMHDARFYHTATLLQDGNVLVVGGCEINDFDPSLLVFYTPPMAGLFQRMTELYNPASGMWADMGALETGRVFHTATLLKNGKVLVAGGSGNMVLSFGSAFSSVELYDPASGKWTPTGNMIAAREGHTATLLPDGRVLVAGGMAYTTNLLSSCELYDPVTGKWVPTGALKTARMGHTATLLSDGKVLVAGGVKSHVLDPASSAELYDPATGKWSATGGLKTGRLMQTATLLPDGRVLIAGGASYMIGAADSSSYFIDVTSLSKAELFDPSIGRAR